MLKELKLPESGMGIIEGTIATWRKREGEAIRRGEILVDVETAKAITEVESPIDGFLDKILAGPGVTVPVNAPIALLRDAAVVTQCSS